MTKQELILAIKNCKEVSIVAHIHEHFCIHVKAVKADLLRVLKYETEPDYGDNVYNAQMVNDVLLIG